MFYAARTRFLPGWTQKLEKASILLLHEDLMFIGEKRVKPAFNFNCYSKVPNNTMFSKLYSM